MANDALSGKLVLGRYRVVALLARGGMGVVYLGRLEGAAGFAKPVVIKTIIPDPGNQGAAQLFAREARILANLEHPHIVAVLDFGEVDGEYVMVLEYVHGFHLGVWHRYVRRVRGSMRVDHAVEVMLPVLDALEYAHGLKRADGSPLGIVHRDVSPANILLDQTGHVKLHDFGIARIADDEFKTQDGTFRGTLSYAAPETLEGIAAGPRSDLYAAGVILYQLLSGTNPFLSDQPSSTLHRVIMEVPPRLSTLRDDVPAALDAALAKAMEKDPADRFSSAGEFAVALRAARSWTEMEAVADLGRVIHQDFSGPELSQLLGLESLQSRDAAWRASQPGAALGPLRSSRPPHAHAESTRTETSGTPTVRAGLPADLRERGGAPLAAASEAAAPEAPAPPPARRRHTLGLVAGFSVALGLGGAAFGLLRGQANAPAPRFLLIEKQTEADAAASPTSAAAVSAPSSTEPPSLPGGAGGSGPRGSKPAPSEGKGASNAVQPLTAAFQRQRGKIEACFLANPGDGAEQLTLQFQIDAAGGVRGVALQPSALSSSPLGSCVLNVARSTPFPAGTAPISFSIPITAHKKAR